jgi:transcriptional regulator with XRE-family HTH domain
MPQKLKNPLPPVATDNIGKRLADIRKSRGLTQTQLANLIGISQGMVSEYEIGRVTISADMLARFCMALNCSADDVFNLSYEIPKVKTSLRLVKRMNAIDALPETTKKYILKTIDIALEANKMA